MAVRHNFELRIIHKPGKELILADALSRALTSEIADAKAKHLCNTLNIDRIYIDFSFEVLDFSL